MWWQMMVVLLSTIFLFIFILLSFPKKKVHIYPLIFRFVNSIPYLLLLLFIFILDSCENMINYNPNKINKTPNKLNKRISGIVKGYDR
jgi:hypothetical protein